jgi:hypothetical protein
MTSAFSCTLVGMVHGSRDGGKYGLYLFREIMIRTKPLHIPNRHSDLSALTRARANG